MRDQDEIDAAQELLERALGRCSDLGDRHREAALLNNTDWAMAPIQFQLGDKAVVATSLLNLRRTPGYRNKPADDVLAQMPEKTRVEIDGGPRLADDLTWWNVLYYPFQGTTVSGWAADTNQAGAPALVPEQVITPAPAKTFQAGDMVHNAYTAGVNVRRTPGYTGKPSDDVVVALPPGEAATIRAGPQEADGLTWWQLDGAVTGQAIQGWAAEVGPQGQRFLVPIQLKGRVKLEKPFEGSWPVTQLFADRPWFYQKYSYDGVPLRGHNGVDFGTPVGTNILATDDGQVVQVGFEPQGFGHFLKVKHFWGESLYAHLESVAVNEGAHVARGSVVGRAGNTGNSSGPHLHFATRVLPYKRGDGWGGFCDPVAFMRPADVIIPDDVYIRDLLRQPPGMQPDEPGYERP